VRAAARDRSRTLHRAIARALHGRPRSAASPHHDRWSNSHEGVVLDARRCLKCLIGGFIEDTFVALVEFGGKVGAWFMDYPSFDRRAVNTGRGQCWPCLGFLTNPARAPRQFFVARSRVTRVSSRCQVVLDTQNGADASFQVPSYLPHPSLGYQSPLDGSNFGSITILTLAISRCDPQLGIWERRKSQRWVLRQTKRSGKVLQPAQKMHALTMPLLLQPKLNTTLVSWLELVDFLHMSTAVQMVPTIAVRHFMSPIRGKK
jgi:hypothetical protein